VERERAAETTSEPRDVQLSVVTTMYRSAPYLREFHRRAAAAVTGRFSRIEFIFVNDGSPDESLQIALELQRDDPRITIVDLSRNFGHHHALVAGLEHASGETVFLLDSDLEEPPEAFDVLLDAMHAQGADVAFGVQISRKGGPIERRGGALAYRLVDLLAGDLRLPPDTLQARVMTRRYVDSFLQHGESAIVFSYLAATTGFRQIAVPIAKQSKGSTTYGLWKRIETFVDTITAFSARPLHFIAYLGLAILISSFAYIAYLTVVYLVQRSVPAGYTSLAVAIWLLGGLILFSIGVVAIYLSIIFVEVKHRPRYVVRDIHRRSAEP
jgi:putative glycosyltransferase